MVDDDSKNLKEIDGENRNVVTVVNTKFWQTDIKDQTFLDLYNFNGVAFRGCSKYVGDLTSDKYEVKDTAFETVREEFNLDDEINYGTERAYISGIAFLYFAMPDGKDISEPLEVQMVPDFFQVITKSWFVLDNYDLPKLNELGQYELYKEDGSNTYFVHESRFVEFKLRRDKKSSYLPAFRSLTVQDNNLWSIGQAVFRGAAGLTHVKISNPKPIQVNGRTISEVEKVKNDGTFNRMNAETTFISDERTDISIKGVEDQRIPIKDSWEAVLVECSIAMRIPFQLLIGANAGAVVGSETNTKDYLSEVNDKRVVYLNKLIKDIGDKMGFQNIDIEYETLFEETDIEKSNIFETFTKGLKNLIETGTISKESANKYLNEKFELSLEVGETAEPTQSNDNQTETDIKTPFIPKMVPPMISPWDKPKFRNLEVEAANKMKIVLNNHFKFPRIGSAMKGSIFFDQAKTEEIMKKAIDAYAKNKFITDAEQEALFVIEQEVDSFKNEAKLVFSPVIEKGIRAAFTEANKLAGVTIPLTDRAKSLHETIKNGAMDKLTGVSDDIRKELRRELENAMINGESPTQAANRFRKFVKDDIRGKYQRRMDVVARTEMNKVFNSTAQQSYKDSGIVDFNQWITSQDSRVRPAHQPLHGEVVRVGEQFSNGSVYPDDVNERCGVVPYFP